MQRFKLDLSLAQFILFARGEHLDIEHIKFEAYDAPDEAAAKAPEKKEIVRRARRTKAQIEADNAKISSNSRAFPWKDTNAA